MQRDSAISFPMFGEGSINPPPSFKVFGFEIYFYGLCIALGFILAIAFCSRISKHFGIKSDDIYDVVLWLIPFSLLGARLYYVAFRLDYYLMHPAEILAFRDGGLAIYGGVIAGIITIYFVCRRKKIPLGAMLDVVVFGLLLGQIAGRMGNFMNREAFGAPTEIFCRMGLTAPDGTTIYVHPTFLYEMLWNLVCFVFLCVWSAKGRRRYDGQNVFIYFFWYGIGRAWIEGLRTDSLYIGSTGIRVSQALSVALALISFILLILNARKPHDASALYANRAEEKKDEAQTAENET